MVRVAKTHPICTCMYMSCYFLFDHTSMFVNKFYSILFYSILFYFILFYSILFYSILFYSILFYSILFINLCIFSVFCQGQLQNIIVQRMAV